jgi:hypothetical protein
MLLTDFCNRLATCAPDEPLDSQGGPALTRSATSDGADAPADDPGRDALDGAPRAAIDHVITRPPIRRVRTPPDPAGPSIEIGPTGGATRARRYLPRTGRAYRPLTPPSRHARGRSLPRAAKTGFPATSSKATVPFGPGRLPSTSACSAPALSRDGLERRPATDPRTSPPRSGFRRSFAPRLPKE